MAYSIIRYTITAGNNTMTIFLKFPNEEEAKRIFEVEAEAIPADLTIDGIYCAIDIVFGTGEIYKNVGTEEAPDWQKVVGFHVNILPLGGLPTRFLPYVINPNNPKVSFE